MAEEDFEEEFYSESEDVQEQENLGIQSRRQAPAGERRDFNHLWLVSYSDFMTILMIFFLGLYGYTILAKAALAKKAPKMNYTEFAEAISKIKGPSGEDVEVQQDIGKVILNLPEKILFSSGHAELNANSKRTLEDVAKSLKLVDGEIVVEGHTDNVPVRGGSYESNWELSAARSFSVIEQLARAGVPQDRLAAWGFGEQRPVVPNTDAASRAKNRRIEIVVLKKTPNNK